VYYAGRKFDSTTLAELGDFLEDIVARHTRWPVRRVAAPDSFDASTFLQVGGLPVDSGLLAAHPTSPIIYQFDNETGALFVKTLPEP